MNAQTFYRRVLVEAGRAGDEDARRATAAVFHTLRDRLTPDEADQAAAQLPRELKDLWASGAVPGRRPAKMHRRQFYERVMTEGGLASLGEARLVTRAVFGALKAQLSPGEADDVLAQLPRDLKAAWEEA
jgi:uncharacterized protein (DUF2267 family)